MTFTDLRKSLAHAVGGHLGDLQVFGAPFDLLLQGVDTQLNGDRTCVVGRIVIAKQEVNVVVGALDLHVRTIDFRSERIYSSVLDRRLRIDIVSRGFQLSDVVLDHGNRIQIDCLVEQAVQVAHEDGLEFFVGR